MGAAGRVSYLGEKSAVLAMWGEYRKPGAETARSIDEAVTSDLSSARGKRNELLAAYTRRYQSSLQLEHQPSEATLNVLIKRHMRKSMEFAPSSKVTNVIDGRYTYSEPLKLSKHLSLNLDGGGP